MRVFVDVGAHYGETLNVALDPRWAFDRIFSLEPSEHCQQLLRQFRDPRLVLDNRGLSNRTEKAVLHGAGLLGGSVYADKPHGGGGELETISLVRASQWIAENTSADDDVYLKLNCEGSEADILEDLLDSGEELARVRSLYVDFDIRKIPSQAHRQSEIESRLRQAGTVFVTPEGKGGPQAVVRWLEATSPSFDAALLVRMRYALRLHQPFSLSVANATRAVLPRSLFRWLAGRFGRQARRAHHTP